MDKNYTNLIDGLSPSKQKLLKILKEKKLKEINSNKEAKSVPPFSLINKKDREKCAEDIIDAYPISVLQMGMLHHMDMSSGGESPADYHNLTTFRGKLRCSFNRQLFQESINRIVEEHDNLRTSFDLTTFSIPLQLVHKKAQLKLGFDDLRAFSADVQENIISDFINEENKKLFDIYKAPLMRFHVHQLSDDIISLSFTEPHSVSDGWSTHLTIMDIFDIYFGLIDGVHHTLPKSKLKYSDFISEELKILSSKKAHSFWDEKLGGFNQTELPFLKEEIKNQDIDVYTHKHPFKIPRNLAKKLHQVVSETGIPFKGVLLAVHLKFLSVITGQKSVTTGLAFNGRLEEEDSANMRGMFLNTLPVSMNLSDCSWRTLINAAHEAEIELLPYRRFPFGAIQKKYGSQPIFHTHLGFLHFHSMEDKIKEGNVKKISNVDLSKTNFDLSAVFCMDPADKYNIEFLGEVNLNKISKRQFIAYLDIYIRLIEHLVENIDASHLAAEYISPEEKRFILNECNNTYIKYDENRYIHECIENQVKLNGNKIAAKFDGAQITYDELDIKSNQLANYLLSNGIENNELVGLCLDRSIFTLVSMLGILKAGGAYLPVDPDYPLERLEFMIVDAQVRTIITESKHIGKLPLNCISDLIFFDQNTTSDYHPFDFNLFSPRIDVTLSLLSASEQLAYVIYTSGSTGKPKGVRISHKNVVSLIENKTNVLIEKHDVVAQASNISFDAATFEIWNTLSAGGTLVGIDKNTLLSPNLLRNKLVNNSISVIFLTTALFNRMAEESPNIFSSLRKVLFGGEAHSLESIRRVLASGSPENLIHVYGPTETTTFATSYQFNELSNDKVVSAPIGKPLSNHQCYVLDSELKVVSIGSPGELYIGGDGLALGYLNRSDLTNSKFIDNHLDKSKSKFLYKTGDRVRLLNDGNIEFIGRVDNQVKVRGFRIELDELITTLQSLKAIKDCTVTVQEYKNKRSLIAYLVFKEQLSENKKLLEDVKSLLFASLPAYMIPNQFVVVDELPLTANGKVDKKALPLPQYSDFSDCNYIPPRNDLEIILCEIWQEVLNVDRVGIKDNFFSLGGDSILSIQVVSKANKKNINIGTRDIFESQTIEQLIGRVSSKNSQYENKISMGKLLLHPIQHHFFSYKNEDFNYFHQSALLSIPENFCSKFLERFVTAVIQKHDVLRLQFDIDESGNFLNAKYRSGYDGKIQKILKYEKIDNNENTTFENEILKIGSKLKSNFDIKNGPLFNIVYLDSDVINERRLLIIIHHLIVDGVSWRILLDDLLLAYEQYEAGYKIELYKRTTPYQSYTKFLVNYSKSIVLLDEKKYWLEQLDNKDIQVLSFEESTDNTYGSSNSIKIELPREVSKALIGKSNDAFRTHVNELLLSGLLLAFFNWRGLRSLKICLESHGREEFSKENNLSQTMGWFTSIYPLKLKLLTNKNLPLIDEVINGVKESVRSVPNNGIGYGILKFLCNDNDILTAENNSKISNSILFNYLGQFDQQLGTKSKFKSCSESTGSDINPRRQRTHALDISGMLINGKLNFNFNYNPTKISNESIRELADEYYAALLEISNFCQNNKSSRYTLSDFPLAPIKKDELDNLQNFYGKIDDIYPCTSMQSGLIYHGKLNTAKDSYINQVTLNISGNFDCEIFRNAWLSICKRHNILRTGFNFLDKEDPLQVVINLEKLDVSHHDWRGKNKSEIEDDFNKLSNKLRNTPFDFNSPPLMRLDFIQVDFEKFIFVWTYHHIILDGWSQPILFKELFRTYLAYSKGQLPNYSTNPNYRNYISWYQKQIKAPAEDFWREHLLPVNSPTKIIQNDRFILKNDNDTCIKSVKIELSKTDTKSLNNLANHTKVTLNTVIQAAWSYLLHRYSNETNVIFGETVSGRNIDVDDISDMIGLFIRTIPSVVSFDEDLIVSDWLKRLHHNQTVRDQFSYLPLTDIKHLSSFHHSDALFEIAIVFENYPIDQAPSIGIQDENEFRIDSFSAVANAHFPLSLIIAPSEILTFEISYLSTLYCKKEVELILTRLKTILLGMVTQFDKPISKLPLFSDCEDTDSLIKSDYTTDYDDTLTIPELFGHCVSSNGDNLALTDKKVNFTYSELDAKSTHLAHALTSAGLCTKDRIIIHLERSSEVITCILACLKVGSTFIPLDTEIPILRKEFIISDSKPKFILTDNHLVNLLPETKVDIVLVDDLETSIQYKSEYILPSFPNTTDAYIIYTSGSTGNPKGVVVGHASMGNLAAQQKHLFDINTNSRILQFASLSFDAAIWEILMALCHGSRLYIIDSVVQKDPKELTTYLIKNKITHATLPPALLSSLDHRHLSSLEILIVAGESISSSQANLWSKGRKLFNAYGPTENTVCVSVGEITGKQVHIGKPIGNVACLILDNFLRSVPQGSAGELYVSGRSLSNGYLNLDEITNERFVRLPEFGNNLFYRTGDRVRLNSFNNLEFIGRFDDQIKIRGYRIELGEIESVLNQHALVNRCSVVHQKGDSINDNIVSFVEVITNEMDQSELYNELLQFLTERLPVYMIPSKIQVIDSIPINHNGKVDKNKLLADHTMIDHQSDSFVPAKAGLETTLMEIWKSLLKIEIIGVKDNFFSLGGNSILAMRLREQIENKFEANISVTDIFNYPTIEKFSNFIENEYSESPLVIKELSPKNISDKCEIAIIGMSSRLGGTKDYDEFWDFIVRGSEDLVELTNTQLTELGLKRDIYENHKYVRKVPSNSNFEDFDAEFFGLTDYQASLMDPQHRVLLECAYEALEISGYPEEPDEYEIGVYVGKSDNIDWIKKVLHNSESGNLVDGMEAMKASSGAFLSTQISYYLNLTGPSINLNTACSTSLVAVHEACQSIRRHECTMALAGGVSISTAVPTGYLHQDGFIASEDGHCRPFDNDASGTRVGQGAGIVLLKRLDLAIRDGDTIHGVIKGTSVNNDGSNKVGYTAPSIEGQAKAVARAISEAGVDSKSIGFVEAHGTGTYLGDPIEVSALKKAFKYKDSGSEPVLQNTALGTLKANIGHLDAAAGIAGLIKTTLCVKNGLIVPNINFNTPNNELDLENSPFYLNKEIKEWCPIDYPRRGGVSSFGIGGTNAHVIIEEANRIVHEVSIEVPRLFPLSARSADSLTEIKSKLNTYLSIHSDQDIADIAFTLQCGRKSYEYRDIFIASSIPELNEQLDAYRDRNVKITETPKIVFMFPGQGTQWKGMFFSLYEQASIFRGYFNECIDLFNQFLDKDLKDVIFSSSEIDHTIYTQPALFSIEYAFSKYLMDIGVKPDVMIGHSIGEYVAACLAGVFSLADAVIIVAHRARLMQSLPEGKMVSIQANQFEAEKLAEEFNVCIAAINTKENIVLSGLSSRMTALIRNLKDKKIKFIELKGNHPFHSKEAVIILEEFNKILQSVQLKKPRFRLLSNITGDWVEADHIVKSEYWTDQLAGCVKFSSGISSIHDYFQNVDSEIRWVEVGPGRVLSGLVASQLPGQLENVIPLYEKDKEDKISNERNVSILSKLWSEGYPIIWKNTILEENRKRIPLPTYSFQRKSHSLGQAPDLNKNKNVNVQKSTYSEWFYVPSWERKCIKTDNTEALTNSNNSELYLLLGPAKTNEKILKDSLYLTGNTITITYGKKYLKISDYHYEIDPTNISHFNKLFGCLDTRKIIISKIIDCSGIDYLNNFESKSISEDSKFLLAIVINLITGLKSYQTSYLKLLFLTMDTFEITGYEEINPIKSMIASFSKSACAEYEWLDTQVVDVDIVDDKYNLNWEKEVFNYSKDKIVALRQRFRYVESYKKEIVNSESQEKAKILQGGNYLIIGGVGGMGLTAAEVLSESSDVNITLASRNIKLGSSLDDQLSEHHENVRSRVKSIVNLGSSINLRQLDVCNRKQVEGLFQHLVNEDQKLDGIIFSAGVPGLNNLINNLTVESVYEVISAKVSGLSNLLDGLISHNIEPDFFIIMSSLQTVADIHKERADYGAANRFADSFSILLARKLKNTRVQVINWNTWNESGMAVNAVNGDTNLIYKNVLNSLTNAEGSLVFKSVLNNNYERVAISSIALEHLLSMESEVLDTRNSYQSRIPNSIDIKRAFQEIILEIFGLNEINYDLSFQALGGDSLAAIRLSSKISDALNINLPMAKVIESETMSCLLGEVEVLVDNDTDSNIRIPMTGKLEGPLTYAQQRLWFIDVLEGQSAVYNQAWSMKLTGPLNVSHLQTAISRIIDRHSILRTTFHMDGDSAIQRINTCLKFELNVIDLSEIDPNERLVLVRKYSKQEQELPFNLEEDLMIRASLIKLADEENILLFTQHHITTDGFSVEILLNEITSNYNSLINGISSKFRSLPVQYIDYALWQRETLESDNFNDEISSLTNSLLNLPEIHGIPLDFVRPPQQSYKGSTYIQKLNPLLSNELKKMAIGKEITNFMLFQAALSILINKLSSIDNIVIGTPVANRNEKETMDLIGFFVNTMVLHNCIRGDMTFDELLMSVKTNSLQMLKYQHIPFELVVEKLNPERSLSYHPLVQILLTVQDSNIGDLYLDDLNVERLQDDQNFSKFDLSLNITDTDEGFEICWEYAVDLFKESTIIQFSNYFYNLLNNVTLKSNSEINDLSLLTDFQKSKILCEVNNTKSIFPDELRVYDLLIQQAELTPHLPALEFNNEILTYEEFNIRTNQIANYIREFASTKNKFILLYFERSIEMALGVWSVLKSGAAYIPILPDIPVARLKAILGDSNPICILTQSSLVDGLTEVTSIPKIILDEKSYLEEFKQQTVTLKADQLGSSAAYMIYTSGSTGTPKGVINTHGGLLNRIHWMQDEYRLTHDDVVLQKTPYTFDVSVWEFIWPLISGAKLSILEPEGHKDPEAIQNKINTSKVTIVHFVPSMLSAFLECTHWEKCNSVRHVFCSGEALSKELQKSFFIEKPTAELHNLYGPTEASIDVSFWRCERETSLSTVPIGNPINNMQLVVLDNNNRLVPEGVVGELHIGGIGLAQGYLNNPDLTNERFIVNPFNELDTDRLYKTGDYARYKDGVFEYIGRIDDQVKIRGLRIELGEIEYHINSIDWIDRSLVTVYINEFGGKNLVAYFSKDSNKSENSKESVKLIRNYLKTVLPEYMVPFSFIELKSWPLLNNGKIDRKSLPKVEPDISENYVEPISKEEKILCSIWMDYLQVDKIGITDNFFSLGGDSIMSTQIVAKAKKNGLSFTVRDMFNNQTIRELVHVINSGKAVYISQGEVLGEQKLTPVQKHFFNKNLVRESHYNQALLLNTPIGFNVHDLKTIAESLYKRHDVLRLRFDSKEKVFSYAASESSDIDSIVERIDLSEACSGRIEDLIMSHCEYFQANLDIKEGPLFKLVFIELPGNIGRLFILSHHLIIDGVSWRILLLDLETAWKQLSSSSHVSLAAKTTSYQEWGIALSDYINSEKLVEERQYWLAQLHKEIPLAISTDTGISHFPKVQIELSRDESEFLLGSANDAFRSRPHELLITGLFLAYNRWCGHNTVRLNMEGHGREYISDNIDLSETIGWFTSIYPLILSSTTYGNINEIIKLVKDQIRLTPNNGFGFGVLRYLTNDKEFSDLDLRSQANSITFNYLGSFDNTLNDSSQFTKASEEIGSSISDLNVEDELLAINIVIFEGIIHISLSSSKISECSLEQLSTDLKRSLKDIHECCIKTNERNSLLDSNRMLIDSLPSDIDTLNI